MTQHQRSPSRSTSEQNYRAYRLSASGRIEAAEVIEAADDEEAKALAQKLVDGHAIELWDGARFIAVFKSTS